MAISLTVFRLLSRYYVARIVRTATYIALAFALVYIAICWTLAHFFTPWWWLLLVPFVVVFIIFLVLRFIISFIARALYSDNISPAQAAMLDPCIDKMQRLFEIKNINPTVIALTSLKDLAVHRELRTLKGLVDDSKSLRHDLQKISDKL